MLHIAHRVYTLLFMSGSAIQSNTFLTVVLSDQIQQGNVLRHSNVILNDHLQYVCSFVIIVEQLKVLHPRIRRNSHPL